MDLFIHKTTAVQPKAVPENTECFMKKLAALVAQIYSTFSQKSQNDIHEIFRLETSYKINAHEIADLTRSRGNMALGTACVSLLFFAASLGFANENERKFVQLASNEAPRIAQLFESQRDASIKRKESRLQIDQIKLNDQTNRSHSDSNVKDQFASVLQAEMQRRRSASSFQG